MIEQVTIVRKLKSGLIKGRRQYVWRGKHGYFRRYITGWQFLAIVGVIALLLIGIRIGMSMQEPAVISPIP